MGYDSMWEYEESGEAYQDELRHHKSLAPLWWVKLGRCEHLFCAEKGLNGRPGYECKFGFKNKKEVFK